MRFINQAVYISARGKVFVGVVKLMNHGDDEAAKICLQQFAQSRLAVGVFNLDVLGLQLAEQSVHPADELAFQFVAVNDQNDGRLAENILSLQDKPGGGDHGEGLARALRVPDEPGLFGFVGTTRHDLDSRPRLVLAQDGLPQFVILDVKQNPFLEHFQNAERGEEGFDLLLVVRLIEVLPRENVFAVEIPCHAVKEFDDLREVEHLGQGHHFRRLFVVAPDLNQRVLHAGMLLGAFALDHGDGDAVDQEHIIRPIGVATVGVLPFLGNVEFILGAVSELNQFHVALAFLGLDVN